MLLVAAACASAASADRDRQDLVARPTQSNEHIERLSQLAKASPPGTRQRLETIVDLIFSRGSGLGFTYAAGRTLTAAEALEQRQGNCLSLVNLFVAIARGAGIAARFVEVEDFETFYRYEGTILRSTHVVGGVEISGKLVTVDFLPHRQKRYRRLRPVTDERAAVLYFNAVASEAMLEGRPSDAARHFEQAFEVDRDSAETWNNHAMFLNRRGKTSEAVAALERARRLDPKLLPAIENLAGLYRLSGDLERARAMEAEALDRKTQNPYFLLQQALRRLAEGELDSAEGLLVRARRLEPGEPEIYLALGRIELARGRRKAADRLFAQAKKRSATYASGFQSAIQRKIDSLLSARTPDPRRE